MHYRSKIDETTEPAAFIGGSILSLYSRLTTLYYRPKFESLFWQLGENALCDLLGQAIADQFGSKRYLIFSELKVDKETSKGFVDLCVVDDLKNIVYIIETKYHYEKAKNASEVWSPENSASFYDGTFDQAERYVKKSCDLWDGKSLYLVALGFSTTEFATTTVIDHRDAWWFEPKDIGEFYAFETYSFHERKAAGLAIYGKVKPYQHPIQGLQ
jgi:hypothetical protein